MSKLSIKEVIKNKHDIIQMKRMEVRKGKNISLPTTKAMTEKAEGQNGRFKAIGSTSMFMDSDYDVLLPQCYNKSIADVGVRIPFIHDHIHTAEAKVAKVHNVYTEVIDVTKMLPEANVKNATALIFDIEPIKEFNEKIYAMYHNNEIHQHSIGLQYGKMELAANDPEYTEEFNAWNKYKNQLINPWFADEIGYFWVVKEIRVWECSAVLFGSNSLTDTIEQPKSTQLNTEASEQSKDTQENNDENDGVKPKSFLSHLIEKEK